MLQKSDHVNNILVCGPLRTCSGFYLMYVKRPIELFVTVVAVLFCLPIMALLCLFISLETPGCPIYRQKRVGLNGRIFNLYKLRTMYAGTEHHGFRTGSNDRRVTRFGKFLRETKIDEIPQLFNVLRGDMSLIGPRPLSRDEVKHFIEVLGYSTSAPGLVPSLLPGLTGLEQIYRIHPHSYDDRFRWNAQYELSVSLLLDLRIVLTTVLSYRLICLATILGGILELFVIVDLLCG